jgi:hypothetical protein
MNRIIVTRKRNADARKTDATRKHRSADVRKIDAT